MTNDETHKQFCAQLDNISERMDAATNLGELASLQGELNQVLARREEWWERRVALLQERLGSVSAKFTKLLRVRKEG